METIFHRLRELSYDLFGVFLPGLILITIISLIVIFNFHCSDLNSLLDNLNLTITSKEHKVRVYFYGSSLLVFSYLAGHVLQGVSKEGLWRTFIPRRILAVIYKLKVISLEQYSFINRLTLSKPTKPPSYDDANFNFLKKPILEKLGIDASNVQAASEKWGVFYLLTRNYASMKIEGSLLTTFQNKYTFHRSLSSAFAAQFWLSSLCLIFSIWNSSYDLSLINIVSMIFSLMFCFMFNKSFEYFWTQWGNTLVSETFIHLHSSK